MLSFLTVLLAASGPARQMGKIRPIEAIKENWNNVSLEKSAKHTFLKRCFGFLGKISANSLIANKKLFRTCTVTLCLCMVLMFSSVSYTHLDVYKRQTWPFENDTSAITKKIAKNDIDKNRVKRFSRLLR